jgi:hypothetical protein
VSGSRDKIDFGVFVFDSEGASVVDTLVFLEIELLTLLDADTSRGLSAVVVSFFLGSETGATTTM